jgi:tetratricopeptide (TPR) repeat protein
MLEETLIQVQQGQVDKFEGFLRREVDKGNPDSPLIFEALVEGYMRLHRLLEASTCLAAWEKLQPDNMYLYFLRGSIRERIPNFEAAMDDYRKVLELNPEYEEARLRLCRILIERHQFDEALPHLLHLHSAEPGNLRVMVLLARCYMDQGQLADARQLLAEAIVKDPLNQPALLASAQLAMQDGATETAEEILRRALALDRYDREANFLMAQCLLRQPGKQTQANDQMARFKQIEEDWKRLHEITSRKIPEAPHDPELQYQVGAILLRLGDERTGVEWFKRALETNPRHEASRKALAEHGRRLGSKNGPASGRDSSDSAGKDELSFIPR